VAVVLLDRSLGFSCPALVSHSVLVSSLLFYFLDLYNIFGSIRLGTGLQTTVGEEFLQSFFFVWGEGAVFLTCHRLKCSISDRLSRLLEKEHEYTYVISASSYTFQKKWLRIAIYITKELGSLPSN